MSKSKHGGTGKGTDKKGWNRWQASANRAKNAPKPYTSKGIKKAEADKKAEDKKAEADRRLEEKKVVKKAVVNKVIDKAEDIKVEFNKTENEIIE